MEIKKSSVFLKGLVAATLAIACLLSMGSFAFASSSSSDDAENEIGYFTYLYDNSNGLPTSEANAIAQTSIGFIWIGGYSGLTRYEGTNFTHFDAKTGVANVNCLYVDSKDRLWIGTNDSGIAVRERAQFRFWAKGEGLISLSIKSIAEDAEGNIFGASTEGLGYIDSNGAVRHIYDERISDKYIRRLAADKDGVIYGITTDGCVFAIENLEITTFYTLHDLGIDSAGCITPDPTERGKVYIGTGSSEIVVGNIFDGMKNAKIVSTGNNSGINDIYFASDGKIWIASNCGLGYFDTDNKYKELNYAAMTGAIESITEDIEGNIWCTSSRQGVMKVVKTPFVDITGISGLERTTANTTCIYQGDLYIGNDNGLQVLDRNYKIKSNALTELLEGVRIRSIKGDSAGNLWLCTYGSADNLGLICYHGDGTYDIFNEEKGMVSNKIRTLTELSTGTVAVAASGGVNFIKDGKVIGVLDASNGITNTEILSISEGDDGLVYFGSDGGGLYIYNFEDRKLECKGLDDGLKSQVIMQIHKDNQRGVYWMVTSNSIAYMRDGKINTLSNFPYSDNFDMQFDETGGVWVLSSSGIYFVNGDELMADPSNLLYSFYDIRSGLPSVVTPNSRNYISPNGTLYIAGNSGVSSININKAREGKNDAPLAVPFITIDDKEFYVHMGETVVLPSDCQRISIHAYAMTYAHNPQISYYLEGFDKNETTVSRYAMQPVTYTNLKSGEYTFHMAIVDVMTGEKLNSIEVTIIKEKALYENVWFWLLIVVAIALIVLLIVRVYVHHKIEKLRQKELEDRKFIREIIQVFAKTIDIKDAYTNGHSFRVAEYTKMIAQKAGYSEAEVEKIYNIGLMHDIGKITIPNEILNKPGKLTDEEFVIMKSHASNGYEILKDVEADPQLALGAGFHHERIDGRGYPAGKVGDEIPNVAQMIAVADTFDAMYSTRPYRTKMPIEKVVAELERVSGTQLNEKYVKIMLELIEEGKAYED